MDVTIREAESGDVTGLEILRAQAVKRTFEDDYDRGTVAELVATVDADLPAWIDDDRHHVVLAETEITPVCYGVLDCQDGELLTIVTSPDYRREGFATELLARIESHARELDLDSLTASAPRQSAPFFEKRGFEPTGDGSWYDIQATRYVKALSDV